MAGIISSTMTPINPPQTNPSAAAASQATDPTAVTPATSTPAAPITTATGTASTYNPTNTGQATQWNVSPDQTVQGQLDNILNGNSPIIQQARSNAMQTANNRGLLNSSMAATAGESAAISNALPIATSDSQTMAKAAGYNADEANQFAVKNADIANTAGQFNSQQQQNASFQNAAAENTSNQFNAQQQQQNSQFNAGATNTVNQFNAQNATQNAQFNVSEANKIQIENIDAQYKELMQTSASASDTYKQVMSNIQAISASTDMDANAKQVATDNQLALLKNALQVEGALSNINIGSLVDFGSGTTSTGNPTLNTGSQAYIPPDLFNFRL